MRIIPLVFFGLLIFLSIFALHGETSLTSLEEIAQYGAEHSLSYQSSQIDVLEAVENRTGIIRLEDSEIDFSVEYNETDSVDNWDISSSLTIPVIEQISLYGKIDEELSGKMGITLSPLKHSETNKQSEIEYNSALISSENVRLSSESNAVSAALDWMIGYREFVNQKKLAELKKISYSDDKVRYDLGEITLDDLQTSLINWSEARIDLSEKEVSYRNSETTLYSALGSGKEDISIALLSLEDLQESLEYIKSSLEPQSGNPLKNNVYQLSLLNVSSARITDKNTWMYEPDLETSAYVNFDSDGSVYVSADLSLSFSLDQIQVRESRISEKKLEISLKEAEQSRNEAELIFQQITDSISSTSINSEIAQLELEQAEILVSEAELLQKLGEYSLLELEEIRETLSSAENSFFESLANEYSAWLQLKEYL